MGEFELIARHCTRAPRRAALGVGDDCALLDIAPGQQLAVSSDMLVEGRHFLPTVPPERLGHKALAVNLSDLAACGAEPLACTLAWSLPRADEDLVAGVMRGFWALADAYGVDLIGGDTTAGPLNLCITVLGQVPRGQALLRSGARPEDELWVSGTLGAARLALEAFRGTVQLTGEAFEQARRAMELPAPRVALGMALRGVASSAIDLSDGLAGDLRHVLAASGVGAEINVGRLPHSPLLAGQPETLRQSCVLAGGDDYELLFTAPPSRRAQVLAAAARSATPVTCCGRIVPGRDLVVLDDAGQQLEAPRGFDHFA